MSSPAHLPQKLCPWTNNFSEELHKYLRGARHSVPRQPSGQHFSAPGHSSSTEHAAFGIVAPVHSGTPRAGGHLPAVEKEHPRFLTLFFQLFCSKITFLHFINI